MTSSSTVKPACKNLVLDAGPLLSLSPLRGLAETYYTLPQVLDELKDKRAREHFERLGLSAGCTYRSKDLIRLRWRMAEAAKNAPESVEAELIPASDPSASTGDDEEAPAETPASIEGGCSGVTDGEDATEPPASDTEPSTVGDEDDEVPKLEAHMDGDVYAKQEREPLDGGLHQQPDKSSNMLSEASLALTSSATTDVDVSPLYDNPSDSDDGEGEWITPSNVALHKSRALDLLPAAADARTRKGKGKQIPVACMTADFAMQNVLLQMSLGLVGVEGKRIERVKSWVMRCHACFKISKDASRKFCPSCGTNTPAMQVHLKKNFQYKTRGTIYSIPAPKPGSAKTGPGEGLVLREDQTAWMRAKKHADGKREREERRMLNAASRSTEVGQGGAVLGSWMDPDWVPEILSTGTGGKGRTMRSRGMDGDMPIIGHGRKNPNERKRQK
ncbi:20S-pre-rRNA D-site endonuclease nob1 [Grifola frondosa]|uniref:20S-pre-rRNA D-site endonuclease nob1 n=1 Tax=Grifola frondosa TaxID=5627 RepID=A0A1C7MHE8_GRIFR|nr:20S-pre-rRNA D-site endonuclease nob1 [Grifola frondosa]